MKRIVSLWAVVLVLIALVVTIGVAATGCGGSDQKQAKADLSASLSEFETAVANLQKMGPTSTVADLKKANDSLKPIYDKIVQNANKVSGTGADVAEFQSSWKALQDAVDAIPNDASIVTAAISVIPKIAPVVKAEAALKDLATK